MIQSFSLNGVFWRVKVVPSTSKMLIDRTNNKTVATTDPRTHCIYLSDELSGKFRETVLLHEIGHAVMISFGLLQDLHSFVPIENWIYAEEWICNFLADYAKRAMTIAKDTIEDIDEEDVWYAITSVLEGLFE